MPTRRGIGVLAVAVGAYLGGRLVGTYELYLVALALVSLVALSSALVLVTGTRLRLRRDMHPVVPTAGDRAQMGMRVRNRSIMPTAPLRLTQTLGGLAAHDVVLDASPLPPRAVQETLLDLPPLRRGRFDLPPAAATVVDPLGIARRTTRIGDPLEVTVLPRISRIRSCVFFGSRELGMGRRAQLTPVSASIDLRGVRPHQPGEPLSRIDWKSTAKVGSLMLKEMEEPGRTDVVIVLDGTSRLQVGMPPEDSFELVVSAAGSIGDYVLREGFPLTLLLHGQHDLVEHIDGQERGRKELLLALAELEASATLTLAATLDQHHAFVSRGLAVVVVTTDTSKDLMLRLVELREKGTRVFLVHVDGPSFGARDAAVELGVRERSFLLELQHNNIPSVTLRRDDDIELVLAFSDAQTAGRTATGGARP